MKFFLVKRVNFKILRTLPHTVYESNTQPTETFETRSTIGTTEPISIEFEIPITPYADGSIIILTAIKLGLERSFREEKFSPQHSRKGLDHFHSHDFVS